MRGVCNPLYSKGMVTVYNYPIHRQQREPADVFPWGGVDLDVSFAHRSQKQDEARGGVAPHPA